MFRLAASASEAEGKVRSVMLWFFLCIEAIAFYFGGIPLALVATAILGIWWFIAAISNKLDERKYGAGEHTLIVYYRNGTAQIIERTPDHGYLKTLRDRYLADQKVRSGLIVYSNGKQDHLSHV